MLDGILEGLDFLKESFVGGLKNVVTGLSNLGDTIGGFFEWLLDGIGDISTAILDGIGDLLEWLLDGIGEVLKFLFVPSDNLASDLKEKIYEKFPFIQQIVELVDAFLDLGNNATAPQFTFTYHGTTVSIVNFADFDSFMPLVRAIILAVAWFTFIFRLYKRLPSIIGGFHT